MHTSTRTTKPQNQKRAARFRIRYARENQPRTVAVSKHAGRNRESQRNQRLITARNCAHSHPRRIPEPHLCRAGRSSPRCRRPARRLHPCGPIISRPTPTRYPPAIRRRRPPIPARCSRSANRELAVGRRGRVGLWPLAYGGRLQPCQKPEVAMGCRLGRSLKYHRVALDNSRFAPKVHSVCQSRFGRSAR